MHNHESKQENTEAKEIHKFLNKLGEKEYHWGNQNKVSRDTKTNDADLEKLVSSSLVLKVITSATDKEGYFAGLGNLEDILLNIALSSSPESNSFILNNNYGIKNLHSSEEMLSTFELLSKNFGELNPELKNAYLQNLELEYTNIIKNCTQEYECINEQLLSAEQRASAVGIDKEQIQKFRTSIESWAYTPEIETS